MIWHNPLAFFLFIPLLCILVYLYFFSKKTKGTFFYSELNTLKKEFFSLRSSFIFLPKLLKFIALVFFIIALARPQTTEDMTSQSQKGVDIMIVMDISLSMLIKDMGQMNRLEASRKVVKNFIEGRAHDRIGLIVFSGESFTKVPLTFDHDLLQNHLAQVQTLPSIKDGTAIGVALANATARLKHSPPSSRIVIFLTDGDNNTGFIDPETALKLARKNTIKIYTIGIGSQSGTFPVKYKFQSASGKSFYRRVYITSKINEKLMQKISSQTGGEFFMAKNLTSLERIFKKIDELETYDIQINKWTQYTEHFANFLLIGLVSYFLSIFLSLTVFFRGI